MSAPKRGRWMAGTALLCLTLVVATVVLSRPMPRPYAFVPDHPVQMWQVGKDRWAYYCVDLGKPEDLAKRVRADLVADGYREDGTRRPWFCFVKGDQEMVVCDGGEFATGTDRAGNTMLLRTPRMAGMNHSQCVLVKNGMEKRESLALFKVKKLIHGW